ncbi:aldehyde dehydrogenase family protein [Salipaludibacillus keqinensis]|uniref:Aldehyde dehydrogenase n=1 Tax=Salipaludibacillus keqinensis TaxID=2045207 RepID=A0A323TCH3_9BACI|nr:aldehyde dehydrogenase [Salipaludibacillus keqinensis]PYZ92356.1 aldehyde dehydrogenase family protein [Salipaludibacillus keqinensis]
MKDAIQSLVQKQKQYFYSGESKDIAFRKEQLQKLKNAIKDRERDILDAVKKDLNKSEHEAFLTEIGFLYNEIKDMVKNIDYWATPRKEKTPITHFGGKSYVYKEPYGVTLIISPWNYPFQLAVAPLIGAIGAGNTAIIKPSEFTPNTSMVIRDLIASTFPEKYIAVVEGDAEVSKSLLDENVDYIFFTGSTQVGKKVMEAASKHLTPVTLELGGKSPAIIMDDANLKIAAKRIVWGKFINAGQTCVAPDYILVHEKRRRKFLKLLMHYTKKWFGEEARKNRIYPKIVHEKHVDRLVSMIDQDKVFYGGGFDREKRYVEPTIMMDVNMNDDVMAEEIFGPILPIMFYKDDYEIIDIVRQRPNPLALYLFTENKESEKFILSSLSFGGGCVNDTIMHLATPYLPFGGVGESGMGAYHGKSSFDTFTHEKSVLKQPTSFDLPIRYGQSDASLKTLRRMWD